MDIEIGDGVWYFLLSAIRININGTFILSLDIVNMVDFFLIRCLCELVLSYLGYIGIEEGVERCL